MGSISKEKFQSGQGMDGGTDLLQVVYGDVTLGVGGTCGGKKIPLYFLLHLYDFQKNFALYNVNRQNIQ